MDHPTYPNSTIAEALCEIHFRLPAEHPWSPGLPGALWKDVADEFPEIEPLTETNVGVELRETGLQPVISERRRYRFSTTDRKRLLQASETTLTYNALQPYPGWAAFKSETLRFWSTFCHHAAPDAVGRIGLRYINRIARSASDETPDIWIRDNEYVAPKALRSAPPLLSRLQAQLSPHDRIIVTLGVAPSEGHGDLVFDIDCIREANLTTASEHLGAAMDEIHEHVWEVFAAARSEHLEALLRRT